MSKDESTMGVVAGGGGRMVWQGGTVSEGGRAGGRVTPKPKSQTSVTGILFEGFIRYTYHGHTFLRA